MNTTVIFFNYLPSDIKYRIFFVVGDVIWILLRAKLMQLIKQYKIHYLLDYLIYNETIINRLDIYSKNIIYYFNDVFNQNFINYLKSKIHSKLIGLKP